MKSSVSRRIQVIAIAFPFFGDKEADAAAEKYIGSKAVLDHLRSLAKKVGPRGVFGR